MDNADLEKLKITPGKLVPKFTASVTDYSVTVGSGVKEVKLSPLTSDGGASYVIKGADSSKVVHLTEGKTQEAQVIVSAEDGQTTKTYTISIRRLSADDATLAQLEISVGVLQPAFSPFVTSYECYVPSSAESVTLRAKTEDSSMSVSMKDGSSVGAVQLNPGRTLIELSVQSVSGTSSTIYKITTVKCRPPCLLRLKSKNTAFECAVCCGLAHCPSHIKDGPYIYCQACLEELTRTNKMDPFTGRQLEDDDWMVPDFDCDIQLAKQTASCPIPGGTIEATMQQIGAKMLAERLKSTQAEEPTQACPDCSKKVPTLDMALHKEMLCSAHHTISLPKQEVKAKSWERRLVDESYGSNVPSLLKKASELEVQYLKALPKPGETPHHSAGKAPLDFLQSAACCYATVLKCAPRDVQAHVGLGLVMEEFFYAEDLFGLQRDVQEEKGEGEAEVSSKEEEFLAICQLHGVGSSAPVSLQLKAVEAEYHSLKEAGQTHKADHVQNLHAWKSKKVLEASQGSYSVDSESPLYWAKLKLQDAVSINSSDPTACYHLGRLCLLLGDREVALQYLTAALALKPTHSPTRLCLGLTLPSSANNHTKELLVHGLSQYLVTVQESHETQAEPEKAPPKDLHAKSFYHPSNTLVMDAFYRLAELGGHAHLSPTSCLLCVTSCIAEAHLQHRANTYRTLLWSSLRARSLLLTLLHKQKDPSVLQHCHQLSALLASSGLTSTPDLRKLQMEVFQLGVVLQPSSSEALCHLGNGQLTEYDATSEESWVKEAELSFRASIAMEGKAISSSTIPDQLKEQEWWKKRIAPAAGETKKTTPTSSAVQKQPTPATTKQPPAASKQPPSVSKQPPSASKQPPSRGRPAPQGARTQPAARQPAKTSTAQSAAKRPTGPATKQPSGPTRPGQRGTPTKPAGQASSKGELTHCESKTSAKKPQQGSTPSPSQGGKEKKEESSSTSEASVDNTPAPAPPPTNAKVNKQTYHPRLGLARTLAKCSDKKKQEESHSLYQEVIKMSPQVHDAYIELGEMLAKSNPVAAVEVYARFPFSDPPTFDDAFLHGEIVRLLMKSENYDAPHLCTSLIAMGKALGIGVLDKQVGILESKFKTGLLKKVYSGVHGKPVDDPELQAFFKFKCWL